MNNSTTQTDKLQKLLSITANKYDAMLYDCDGTLADNMHLHKAAYVQVLADRGLAFDASLIDEFAGLPTVKVIDEINKRYHTNFDPQEIAQAKSDLFYNEYIKQTQRIDFVVDHLLMHLDKSKIAVVSGGSRKTVQKTLTTIGLLDKIEVMVCAGETEHGKPSPDPFLKAAALLGVAPEKCMVFEDGEAGTIAAAAAGMDWVRIDWL